MSGLIREFRASPPQPAQRSTALVLPDSMNPAPGTVGQLFAEYGDSYSAQALAAVGVSPGAAVTNRNLSYTWPSVQPGQDDNMQAAGQAVAVPDASAGASTLGFLGAATNGPSTSEVALLCTPTAALPPPA